MRLFPRRDLGERRARKRKATRLLQARRYGEAVDLLLGLQEEDPADAGVALNLGYAYFQLGQHSNTVAQWERVIAIEPRNGEAWLNLAAAHNALGHLDRAAEALQRLGEFAPDHSSRHYNLAILHAKRRQMLLAMSELELELALNPRHKLARQLMAIVQHELHRSE